MGWFEFLAPPLRSYYDGVRLSEAQIKECQELGLPVNQGVLLQIFTKLVGGQIVSDRELAIASSRLATEFNPRTIQLKIERSLLFIEP
ncbi:hypothetical protein C2845_PM12G03860 [Panicum miliaceum]|uniref:Uncharacterized protein n=1 Tax=Panicum miliaceum TaxID=4540 RepID=A0A3L6QH00_PANMI|nr:hypothetical protein C2845_PM12G03860 [Panicum miliaceum]